MTLNKLKDLSILKQLVCCSQQPNKTPKETNMSNVKKVQSLMETVYTILSSLENPLQSVAFICELWRGIFCSDNKLNSECQKILKQLQTDLLELCEQKYPPQLIDLLSHHIEHSHPICSLLDCTIENVTTSSLVVQILTECSKCRTSHLKCNQTMTWAIFNLLCSSFFYFFSCFTFL
ncbi:MAG: hypothetical protein AABY22_19145 [Nanoarchaeota archaeon]